MYYWLENKEITEGASHKRDKKLQLHMASPSMCSIHTACINALLPKKGVKLANSLGKRNIWVINVLKVSLFKISISVSILLFLLIKRYSMTLSGCYSWLKKKYCIQWANSFYCINFDFSNDWALWMASLCSGKFKINRIIKSHGFTIDAAKAGNICSILFNTKTYNFFCIKLYLFT